MSKPYQPHALPLILFTIIAFLCFANLGGYPISILDEAKNTEAAREMLVNQSLVPTFNQELRVDKPPLHYFFMQLGYSIFGVNAFGARFFSAFLGLLLGIFMFYFTKKHAGKSTAITSLVVLFSSFFWLNEFHLAVPDPYLIFFLSIGWASFYNFYKTGKTRDWWLFYGSIGLASLAKGPIAILMTGLIALLFFLSLKKNFWKNLTRFQPIWGGIIVLLIASPWFIYVHQATGGAFTEGFFIKHNFQRFSSKMEGHGGTFLLTIVFVFLGLFPLGMFIPQGIFHAYKYYRKDDFITFCGILSLTIILFFCISSTRLPNYTLPAMPFLAILVAAFFKEQIYLKSYARWSFYLSTCIISLVTLAIPAAVIFIFQDEKIPYLSFILLSVVALVSIFLSWAALHKHQYQKYIWSISGGWAVISLILFWGIFTPLWQMSPVYKAKKIIQSHQVVGVYQNFDPAFTIQNQRTFPVFQSLEEIHNFTEVYPQAIFITRDRNISSDSLERSGFEFLMNEKSLFENYSSLIFKKIF